MTDDASFWARIEASAALVRGQPTYTQAGLVLSGNFNGGSDRDGESAMSEATASDVLVIYHGDCPDGFCSAWMAWRKFGDSASYVPAAYSAPPPDVTGKDVYIVDFSYPHDVTLRLMESAKSLVVLDHHATAESHLKPLALAYPDQIVIDMNRSGAGLARDYFQPGLDCWLVDYTQDRDLWRFALPNSSTINAYLHTLPQDFELFDRVFADISPATALELGKGAEAYRDMLVRKVKPQAIRQRFAGYDDIPVVNSHFIGISELLGELAQDALFSVGWFQRSDGAISYSLRSRGGFDVAALAERFGGGGHKAAAGFRRDWPVPEVSVP